MGANKLPKLLVASAKAHDEAARPQSDSPQREQPRLGILHLLVLTACVAFYMGIDRAARLAASNEPTTLPFGGFYAAAGILYGLGFGAALAGLLLFPARRWRGFSFPTHPGEYLLVMTGVGVAIWTGAMLVYVLPGAPLREWEEPLSLISAIVALLAAWLVVFFWVLIRVKAPRWRIFLLTIPISYVFQFSLPFDELHSWVAAARGLPFLTLVVVALWDHREGKRYPWTHWFGVGTRVWFDAAVIGMSLWWALYGATSP